MALTVLPIGLAGTPKIIKQTSATNTADKNVADGASTIYAIRAENDTAAGAAAYLKFYNSAAPVVGTDAPEMILKLPFTSGASGVLSGRTYIFKQGNAAFTTALSLAAVTTGGTAGVTPPTQAVQLTVVTG